MAKENISVSKKMFTALHKENKNPSNVGKFFGFVVKTPTKNPSKTYQRAYHFYPLPLQGLTRHRTIVFSPFLVQNPSQNKEKLREFSTRSPCFFTQTFEASVDLVIT